MKIKIFNKNRKSSDTSVSNNYSVKSIIPNYKNTGRGEIWIVICTLLTTFSTGCSLGFPSPIYHQLIKKRLLNKFNSSWFVSLFSVGAIFGVLIATSISKNFGRKKAVLFSIFLLVVSWLLILSSDYISIHWAFLLLYTSRLMAGASAATCLLVLPMYINESVRKNVRGLYCSSVAVGINMGIFFIYAIGNILPWQLSSILPMVTLIPAAIILAKCTESPYWLVLQQKQDLANNSIYWFRGFNHYDPEELKEITKYVEFTLKEASPSFVNKLKLLKNKKILKIFLDCLFMHCANQFSMINGIISYSGKILTKGGYDKTNFYPLFILGISQLVSTIISALLLDKFGRKIMIMISTMFVIITLGAMGVYDQLLDIGVLDISKSYILLILASCYLFAFNSGLHSIPWCNKTFIENTAYSRQNCCKKIFIEKSVTQPPFFYRFGSWGADTPGSKPML
ncbi:hypothetical protein A3Q56_01342 [Intoshia linei]|uniref:Major facilitator superfamily (MFS) profile domain-containing protein n=1 Tax=Intoshia linei TaxID=1819745 RepID=A0A177BBW1_9BILA|nr:hypothetical protein A3Q56_01342 [Intoshia linei]